MTSVYDVVKGDYVYVAGQWLEIEDIKYKYKNERVREWFVLTQGGQVHTMFDIQLYATRREFFR